MLQQNSAVCWATSPFMVWLAVDEDAQELDFEREMIEDKKHQEEEGKRGAWNEVEIDDEKFGRHERYSGPTSDFTEKEGHELNVKLDYIDDDGHVLNAKEAFRYLSHEFYGKEPGKNKVEKPMKKTEQEEGNHLKIKTANSS